jgi:hypothetical protein
VTSTDASQPLRPCCSVCPIGRVELEDVAGVGAADQGEMSEGDDAAEGAAVSVMPEPETAEPVAESDRVGEDTEEARKPKVSRNPQAPSRQEIDEHYATHLPFRDWCPCCVRGKMKNPAHYRIDSHARGVEEVHLDYCFMEELKILVTRDRNTKVTFSDVVRYKGRGMDGDVERVHENIRRLGRKRLVLRTDQEPALVDLAEAVKEGRTDPTTIEHSPAGESQSNGFIERAIQTVEEQVRTYKLGLEERVKLTIPNAHPLSYMAGAARRRLHNQVSGWQRRQDGV